MNTKTLSLIIIVWGLIVLIGILRDILGNRLEKKDSKKAIELLRPITNCVQILIVALGIMIWLENLGFKATTLLAGLGIGGLAIFYGFLKQKKVKT